MMLRVCWRSRLVKLVLALASLGLLMGTSCGQDVQDSIRAAGLDFVKSSANQTLTTFIPIKDILAGIAPKPPA